MVVKDTILKAIHNYIKFIIKSKYVVKDTILKAIHNSIFAIVVLGMLLSFFIPKYPFLINEGKQ